jgi:hypothetical protein
MAKTGKLMASDTGVQEKRFWRSWGVAGTVLAVALGAALRLLWAGDIEFKLDELWTFERVQFVGATEPFPWRGMPTSTGVHHPGGSVWIFLLLGKLFGATTPPELARACQLVNIAAIVLLVVFAFRAVPRPERELWLWAAALVSVNPMAIILHRKIWPPSLVPLFVMIVLIGWWYRDRRVGAFVWGVMALLLGQIHPAGLFLATGFALWALLFDRRRVRWRAWLAGSCVGLVPLIPWLLYVAGAMHGHNMSQRHWTHAVEFKFWFRWGIEPFGLGLEPFLGKDFQDFLRYPLLAGHATYLVGLLHVLLVTTAAGLLLKGTWRLWQERARWADALIGRESSTAFTQNAMLLGFGVVFTATLLPIYRHYFGLTFPLVFVWLARLALGKGDESGAKLTRPRLCLLGLCVAELLVSVSFLGYVHENPHGKLHGEYGTPYRAQAPQNWSAHARPYTSQDIENPAASIH